MLDRVKGIDNVNNRRNQFYTFSYPCASRIDCTPYTIEFGPGTYNISVYGAQGGSYSLGNGGLGGFASGILSLKTSVYGFIFVGGEGTASQSYGEQYGGYNEGGSGQKRGNNNRAGAGGGGASDVRILGKSFYDRIIVAGGGGGSGEWYSGGYGGGSIGGIGTNSNVCHSFGCANIPSNSSGAGISSVRECRTTPLFGIGSSNNCTRGDSFARPGAGGGGGWFGGDSAAWDGFSAAGGSGYVYTANSYKPPDYHMSPDYMLTNEILIQGVQKGNGVVTIEIMSKSPIIGKYEIISCPHKNIYPFGFMFEILTNKDDY